MATAKTSVALVAAILIAASGIGAAPQGSPALLTNQDRQEIEVMLALYSQALGRCDTQGYSTLFAEPGGYFASGSRGRVEGRKRLIEKIKSYNCVYANGVAPPHAPAVMVPYKVVIEPAPWGAAGTAYYNGGQYKDRYVKTSEGWRFKSRSVVTDREMAAGLSAEAFDAIYDLAVKQGGGPFVDHYESIPGGSRFMSAGVVIEPSPEGARGRAYLKDGGHYEDVYVRTPDGWRLKSRKLMAGESPAAAQSKTSRR